MNASYFAAGINTLISRHKPWLAGKRVALLSHQPAVDPDGMPSAELLRNARDVKLTALWGPEHGFFGTTPAGKATRFQRHPLWQVPIYPLYGSRRSPTPEMLKDVDAVVYDIQDIGVRPYTYVSTLCLLMEAAAGRKVTVIVADRPIPLPFTVDGPVLEPTFKNFVGYIPAPMVYGLTPAETALWLKETLKLDVNLKIARMLNYNRETQRQADWPPWIPPSPAMLSWESAKCYAATVFCEALASTDNGRGTTLPFQVCGAPWMNSEKVCDCLQHAKLPGVVFRSHQYVPHCGNSAGRLVDGIRLVVTDPTEFRPVLTAVSIIGCLQKLYGKRRVWQERGTRPDFFDKLFGCSSVREALLDGDSPTAIASRWKKDLRQFNHARARFLLYESHIADENR